MKTCLEELYASILSFLIKAYNWYNEGKLSHFLHSFTRPLHHLYADLVEEIKAKSRRIDQLSTSASQAELRDLHRLLAVVQSRSQLSDQKMDDILNKMAGKFIHLP